MRILIAGASGDLGTKTAELLVQRGDEVWGLTRSKRRMPELEERGLRPVIADLLDASATATAVRSVAPEAVIQVPIGLPDRGPMRPRDLASTNRLRTQGTANLLEASISSGVRRFIAESVVAVYGYGRLAAEVDESTPVATSAPIRGVQPALDALREQERLVLGAARSGRIEGVLLRVGFYYGAGVGSTSFMVKLLRKRMMAVTREPGALPWVELSDAARGVVAALDHATSGEVYNIVGDVPAGLADLVHELARQLGTPPPWELPPWLIRIGGTYVALMAATTLHVSNHKAKQELGWAPEFPTIQDGIRHARGSLGKSATSERAQPDR